jgi:hypothetical protein
MFQSSGSNTKKIAALGTAFAFVLMSCGGESSSSNEGRSKNAKLVDGVCVWNESEVAELNAAERTWADAHYEVTKWQNEPEFNTASNLLAENPSIEIDGDVYKAAVAADASSRAAQMLIQEPIRQAAEDAYFAVKSKLDASTSADCQGVRSSAGEVFADAVENAKRIYMSSTDPSAAKLVYEASVSAAALVYKDEVGSYPDQVPSLDEDFATGESDAASSTLADVLIVVTWSGSLARVEASVPADPDPARFGLTLTNCVTGEDFSVKSQREVELTIGEGQSCDFAPYEYATSTNGNFVTVTPNVNPPEPTSIVDVVDTFAGISVNATWTDNLAVVELIFASNIDKSRIGFSYTDCNIDRVISQWSFEVTFNEGVACRFSPYEYATRTNGDWVTITAGENITSAEPPVDVAAAEPYLGAVIYDGNRATVELQIPAGADMDGVYPAIGWPLIDGLESEPLKIEFLYVENVIKGAWIELREGESGVFRLFRAGDQIDEVPYAFQSPQVNEDQPYALFAELSKDGDIDILTVSVRDKFGDPVPRILRDYAINTTGQDYGWFRSEGVIQDITDCCLTYKGIEPGREFELVLNQKINGQWTQVDKKSIKMPGNSNMPAVLVPPAGDPIVSVVQSVDVLPLVTNLVSSQIIGADQTEIACDQTCIDSILANAGIGGEVFVQIDGGGEVMLDGTSKVKLGTESKNLKLMVRPSDGSEAVEYNVALLRQQALGAGFESSSSSSNQIWIYLLLAILIAAIVGFILQRRNSVKA